MIIISRVINHLQIIQKSSRLFSNEKKEFSIFPIEEYEIGQRLDRLLKSTKIGWLSGQKYLRNGDIRVVQ